MKNPCSQNDILKSAWILLLMDNVKDKEKKCISDISCSNRRIIY